VIVYQSAPSVEFLIYLELAASPVVGALITDLTVQKWAPGEAAFLPIIAANMTLTELSGGYYSLLIEAEDIWQAFGEHVLQIQGVAFDNIERRIDVVAPPLNAFVEPELCIVSGNIVDIGGNPGMNQNLRFNPVGVPAQSGQSLLTSDKIQTVPDALGNFSVKLIRGQTVVVELERTGIRHQIVVPDQETALILDLLPPIP
jgi:hypothetical protein